MPYIMPYFILTIFKSITAFMFGFGVGLWTSSPVLGLLSGGIVYAIITAVQRHEDKHPKVGEFNHERR
jgi:hypothetical protein